MTENHHLRETFNTAAVDYDAIRPGYPELLIDDICALSGIPDRGRALEIGCGTGQATLPFARRGYSILCLDIGPDLLAVAREKLSAFPSVQFELISFEGWPLDEGKFDLVFSATAFHWIPREIGYAKAAQALKPGGALAVFSNQHPRPFGGFFVESQPIYQQIVPEWGDPAERPTVEEEISTTTRYMESTGLFAEITARTYPWTWTYSTQEYIQLLNTYSNHLGLEKGRRRALHQAIADLINRRYAGRVERPYLSVLHLAKKRAGSVSR